ncbi:hypothetical protein ACHAWU_006282 [Discostella pseudostelligera]|uniref:LAGLIDADG homing endonuclease n=1 Tax=Discostella pseudostelligera TaxID=259834 RepID=A0ABD3M8E4_9STRA
MSEKDGMPSIKSELSIIFASSPETRAENGRMHSPWYLKADDWLLNARAEVLRPTILSVMSSDAAKASAKSRNHHHCFLSMNNPDKVFARRIKDWLGVASSRKSLNFQALTNDRKVRVESFHRFGCFEFAIKLSIQAGIDSRFSKFLLIEFQIIADG